MPNYVQFHTHCKTLLSSLRSHLVNGCTKSTEMKHRCSRTQFRATGLGAEMLSVVSSKGAGGALSLLRCHCHCLWNGCCQTNAECCLPLSPFLHKGEILFGFLSVRENKCCVGLTLPHTLPLISSLKPAPRSHLLWSPLPPLP